ISGSAGVAIAGTTAYVATTSRIDVVDISDPTKPTIVANFGSNDFPSGSGVSLQVYNNELAAVAAARGGASRLLIYLLTNPSSPTLLGQTPLTVQSANDSNVVLSSVANGHAYTAAFWFRFSTPGNQVIQQFGETLDIDISNPAAPAVASVI